MSTKESFLEKHWLTAIGLLFVVTGIVFGTIFPTGPGKEPPFRILGFTPDFAFIVIGIILIVLGWRHSRKSVAPVPAVSVVTRICPQCGRNLSQLPQDITRCPYCGRELQKA